MASAIRANLREQFLARLRGHGAVAGRFDGRLETVADERGVVGDQHCFAGDQSRRSSNVVSVIAALSVGFVAKSVGLDIIRSLGRDRINPLATLRSRISSAPFARWSPYGDLP